MRGLSHVSIPYPLKCTMECVNCSFSFIISYHDFHLLIGSANSVACENLMEFFFFFLNQERHATFVGSLDLQGTSALADHLWSDLTNGGLRISFEGEDNGHNEPLSRFFLCPWGHL